MDLTLSRKKFLIFSLFIAANLSSNPSFAEHARPAAETGRISSTPAQVPANATRAGMVNAFTNPFQNVAYETALETFSPEKFPPISAAKSYDSLVNGDFYNWSVLWQVDGKVFKDHGRSLESVGIAGTPDYNPTYYHGIGTRCVDFIYPQDPNTGKDWPEDTACSPAQTVSSFVSSVPFMRRAYNTYGTINSWAGFTNEHAYDAGVNAASGVMLGGGDRVDGKYNQSWAWADIENTSENGGDTISSFLIGMGQTTRGYAFSEYTQIFNTLGYINRLAYPDSSGKYSSHAPFNSSWLTNYKVSISSRGVVNKALSDYQNIVVGGEISSYGQSTFYQGSQYDKSGDGDWVTVNKFGPNANVENTMARLITNLEQQRWYIDHKLDGRKAVIMTKVTSDRGNVGRASDEANDSLSFKHFDRRQSFMIGLMTFIHKHEWLIWDRKTEQQNLDGYNGVLGLINLVNQKIQIGAESKSAAELYPSLVSDGWDTQVSYDGSHWTSHKGADFQDSAGNLPCRTASSKNGYWVIACVRPEKIEPTDVYVRKTINGFTQTVHITADQWQSTNPAYAAGNTGIPNSDKDYYFNIFFDRPCTDAELDNGFNLSDCGLPSSVGIEAPYELSVYPNPTSDGRATLRMKFSRYTAGLSARYRILDARGSIVALGSNTFSTSANGTLDLPLDLTQSAPGIYFAEVFVNEDRKVIKVLRQ